MADLLGGNSDGSGGGYDWAAMLQNLAPTLLGGAAGMGAQMGASRLPITNGQIYGGMAGGLLKGSQVGTTQAQSRAQTQLIGQEVQKNQLANQMMLWRQNLMTHPDQINALISQFNGQPTAPQGVPGAPGGPPTQSGGVPQPSSVPQPGGGQSSGGGGASPAQPGPLGTSQAIPGSFSPVGASILGGLFGNPDAFNKRVAGFQTVRPGGVSLGPDGRVVYSAPTTQGIQYQQGPDGQLHAVNVDGSLGAIYNSEFAKAGADARYKPPVVSGFSQGGTQFTAPPASLPGLFNPGAPGGSNNSVLDYLNNVGRGESGNNPNAVNPTSGASGQFQFMPNTGAQYGGNGVTAATQFTADNAKALKKTLGREPTLAELSLAQFGVGTAGALIQNPNTNAVDALTPTFGDSRRAQQVVTQNGGTLNMTAAQFAGVLSKKMGQQQPSATQQPAASAPNIWAHTLPIPIQTPSGTKDLSELSLGDVIPHPSQIPGPPKPPPGMGYGPPSESVLAAQKSDQVRLAIYQTNAVNNQKIYPDMSHLIDIAHSGQQGGSLVPYLTDMTNIAHEFGADNLIPKSIDPASAAQFNKTVQDLVLAGLQKLRGLGQIRNSEMQVLRSATPNQAIPIEASISIANDALAEAKRQDKMADLATQYVTNTGGAPLSYFDTQFNKAVPLIQASDTLRGEARKAGLKFPGDPGMPSNPTAAAPITKTVNGKTYKWVP